MSTVDTVDATPTSYLYYRHTAAVRIMHWINVIALTVLFMSGLNIFSAHPALYWGQSSYSGRPPVLEIGAMEDADNVTGMTRILGHDFDTTGLFGASRDASGEIVARDVSIVADYSGQPLAVAGAAMAFPVRLDIRRQRTLLRSVCDLEPASFARSRADAEPTGARSDARSSTTCASIIRPARHRSVTTSCRS